MKQWVWYSNCYHLCSEKCTIYAIEIYKMFFQKWYRILAERIIASNKKISLKFQITYPSLTQLSCSLLLNSTTTTMHIHIYDAGFSNCTNIEFTKDIIHVHYILVEFVFALGVSFCMQRLLLFLLYKMFDVHNAKWKVFISMVSMCIYDSLSQTERKLTCNKCKTINQIL